jgi:type I restriction enzyme S subunit
MNENLPIACGTAMPIGWAEIRLGEICEIYQPETISKKELIENGKYLVYGANGVIGRYDKYNHEHSELLITCRGATCGSVNMSLPRSWINGNAMVIRPRFDFIGREFLRYFFRGYIDFSSVITGSAQPQITRQSLSPVLVPLPPPNEQRRIVEKLDRIFDRLRRVRDELSHIKKLIDRYRQAVLTAAFRGDLTADWRRKNINLVSGSELLEKIKEKQIKNLGSKTKTLFTCGYFDNPIEADFLPDSWTFCQIGNIGTVCNGSTPSRKIPEYWNGCISWVSSGEVRNNIIVATKESITQEGFDNSSVRILPPGTVLLAMIGEGKTRGQTAILKIQATINQNIAAIIIDHGLIVSEYLWYWFQSQYQTTREAGNGSGPQALNCQRVRELLFILPPLEEQKEIVRRVEERFAKIEKIEQEYQKAVKLCDRLEQETLAKAFRGELVPQDPNDEPASVLLERIRSEKKTLTQPKGKSRRQK